MEFEIIGAGAIGLLFGGALASAGHRVHFWTRTQAQADRIQTHGVEIITLANKQHVEELTASSFTKQTDFKTYADWIILAVKQPHLNEDMMQQIKQRLGPRTNLVCLLNGVGHMERLGLAFPECTIIAAVTTEGSKRMHATSIIRSLPGKTSLGIPRKHPHWTENQLCQAQIYTEILAEAFTLAGISSASSNDIDKEIYRKLLINAAINPLTALWRVPNGELLANERRKSIVTAIISEILAIYDRHALNFDEPMIQLVFKVCEDTQTNTSSMLKDVLAGEPTEIDQILGHLMDMAASAEVEVPLLRDIYKLVAAI